MSGQRFVVKRRTKWDTQTGELVEFFVIIDVEVFGLTVKESMREDEEEIMALCKLMNAAEEG